MLGALHALLLFDGDILTTYAVIGVGLLLVRSLPAGWLAGLGAALVLGQALVAAGLDALGALVVADEGEATVPRRPRAGAGGERGRVPLGRLPRRGGRAGRGRGRGRTRSGSSRSGGTVAGMMLLGMAAARVGWVDERRWPSWLRTSIVPLWLVGLALSVPAAWLLGDLSLGVGDAGRASLSRLLYATLGPLMALLWAGAIVRAGSVPVLRRGLDAIAPAGRMSLTVYLAQSLVASLLFNGYGLGLGADLGLGGAVALVAVLWGAAGRAGHPVAAVVHDGSAGGGASGRSPTSAGPRCAAPSRHLPWRPSRRLASLGRSTRGEWRNWQTRWIQVPVSERTWGFKSPLAHQGAPAQQGLLCCPGRPISTGSRPGASAAGSPRVSWRQGPDVADADVVERRADVVAAQQHATARWQGVGDAVEHLQHRLPVDGQPQARAVGRVRDGDGGPVPVAEAELVVGDGERLVAAAGLALHRDGCRRAGRR